MTPAPAPLDLLLAVLKNPVGSAATALRPSVWDAVRGQAARHGFTGMLADAVGPWLPASERAWHDGVLSRHYRQYRDRLALLGHLVEAFAEEGIGCVSLKGPLLAARFYKPAYLKKSADLDLLIREADTGRAARLMQRLGGKLSGEEPWHVHSRRTHHLAFMFGPAGNPTPVEIHYRLSMTGSQAIGSEGFVDRSIKFSLGEGFSAGILAPADEAFYLAIHAAGHCFHKLVWLYDAVVVARSLDEEGRERVLKLVREYQQVGRMVPSSLAAKEFFGEPLAPDCSGLARPWFGDLVTPQRIRCMMARPQSVRLTAAQKANYLIDWCCMSDSLPRAVGVAARLAGYKASRSLYILRGQPLGPDVLARTLPHGA